MPHVTTVIFERETPAFVGAELDRLYGARYSSLQHFRLAGTIGDASTYVARTDGAISTVFLYVRRRGVVQVLNEGIGVTPAQADHFAACIFQHYPSVGAIRWNSIDTDTGSGSGSGTGTGTGTGVGVGVSVSVDVTAAAAAAGAPARPMQHLACAQDTVLDLPAGAAPYLASLGGSTRSNIKLRLNKLKRQHPSWTFSVAERGDIVPADVREIVRLGRSRMQRKGKTSTIDADEEERIVQAVAECGYVATVRIDGQLGAGVVLLRQGSNFSLRALGHAAAYDDYRLGFVCVYLSISACAALPGSALFYFGWGAEDYKLRLGGRLRELSTLVIYRSRLHALLAARLAWAVRWSGLAFRLRQRALVLPLGRWWRAWRARQRQRRAGLVPAS